MKETYINYVAQITDRSVSQFLATVQNELQEGADKITVLISSPGGMVRDGISAYNYLKGIPAEVTTHNYGQTDSIAIVIFCAGSKRYCSPNARFLIHGIGFDAQPNQRFDERALRERLREIENERVTISKIISENSTRSLKEIEEEMFQGVVWNPQEAMKYGLVHEIREQLFEKGAKVINVLEH